MSRSSRDRRGALSIAVTAGGLSVVASGGFPLPAFLSYCLGADERPAAGGATRILQGLVVGGLVAIGFLGLFSVVGLEVSLGVGATRMPSRAHEDRLLGSWCGLRPRSCAC